MEQTQLFTTDAELKEKVFKALNDGSEIIPSGNGEIKMGLELHYEDEEEKEYQDFIADPENKKKGLMLAEQIIDVMGNKWFTIEKLAKKSGLIEIMALEKVRLCGCFGLVAERMGNGNDGPDKNGKKLFKIQISNKDKVDAINDLITYHQKCIADFELAKKSIEG